jgi:hypothetical protein
LSNIEEEWAMDKERSTYEEETEKENQVRDFDGALVVFGKTSNI